MGPRRRRGSCQRVRARGLFLRQSGKPLARSGRAGGKRTRIIVARLGAIALEPKGAEAGQCRRIESVAERDQRPDVAGFGGAHEESPGSRNVALGEGDQAFGAKPAAVVDRYRQRRAGARAFLLALRRWLFAQRARKLADRILCERL